MTVYITSCVPARQYDELKAKKSKCEEENEKLKTSGFASSVQNKELTEQVQDDKKKIEEQIENALII